MQADRLNQSLNAESLQKLVIEQSNDEFKVKNVDQSKASID